MRIPVIGGGVFLGAAIVDSALARGHAITVFNRSRSRNVTPWNELPPWVPSTDREHVGFTRVDCSRALDAGLVTRPLTETVDAVLGEFTALVDDDPRRRGRLAPDRERELIARWRERADRRTAVAGATS